MPELRGCALHCVSFLRAGCAGTRLAVWMAELVVLETAGVWFGASVLVMYFSNYCSVLICEVQSGYEGVRVTGRRDNKCPGGYRYLLGPG